MPSSASCRSCKIQADNHLVLLRGGSMVGRFRRQTWLTMLAALSIASFAAAQGGNAMLEGIVKDPKGAPVQGATVVLKSSGDGGTRTYNAKTGRDGKFTL